MIMAASLAALLVMLILAPLRGPAKLTVTLFVALAIVFAALSIPETLFRWLAAAGWGLAFGLAFWIGQAVLRFRHARLLAQPPVPAPAGPAPPAPPPVGPAPATDATAPESTPSGATIPLADSVPDSVSEPTGSDSQGGDDHEN